MSKRLMPTYLIKFLENLYNGNKPVDFTRVMVTRQFIAKLKELYLDLGGNTPENYTQILVPKYLQDFFNELEIIEFDDDDISQVKTIPSDLVYPVCRIDAIGGMSYKSENLIVNLGTTGTVNGLTFTIDNGNINVDGTPTSAYAGKTFNNYFPDNSLNGTYTLKNFTSDFPSDMFARLTFTKNGSTNYSFNINSNVQTRQFTFDGTETNFRFEYAFQSETLTAQSGNIKPMITKGSTAPTEFKQGFEGIRDSIVTNVKSYGANLLNISDVAETTTNGITYKIENGVITLNGTATSNTNINLVLNNTQFPTGIFATFNSQVNSNVSIYNLKYNGSWGSIGFSLNGVNKTYNIIDNTDLYGFRLYIKADTEISNFVIKPMLVSGSTAPTEFKEYRGLIDTYTIPSEIQALEGYGRGINSTVYNNVDFASGKYIKKVIEFNLADGQNWRYNVPQARWICDLPLTIKFSNSQENASILMCSKYKNVKYAKTYADDPEDKICAGFHYVSGGNNYNYFTIKDSSLTEYTLEEIVEYVSTLKLLVELATPVETTISDNAPLLEVEEGGKVVLENEYNQDIPSEVVTWIKEN